MTWAALLNFTHPKNNSVRAKYTCLNVTIIRRFCGVMETNNGSSWCQKFPMGKIVATPGALAAFQQSGDPANELLTRHAGGDWGEVCDDDKRLNDAALHNGERLLSAYRLRSGTKVWIITESDRSATTFLLPEEY